MGLVGPGLEEAEGGGVRQGHERIGQSAAFGDALARDVEAKVTGGGGLELLAGGPEAGEGAKEVEEEYVKVLQ